MESKQYDWSPRRIEPIQNVKHQSNTIFRAKGVVNKIIEVKPEAQNGKRYFVANVAIGAFDYDVPVHSGIRTGDIIELIVNGVKLQHIPKQYHNENNGEPNGNA
jgi:hypothetical protein